MKKIVFFIFFLFNIVVVSAQKDYKALIYEGNRAFGNGDYAGASSKFLKASKGKDKDFTAKEYHKPQEKWNKERAESNKKAQEELEKHVK